MDASKRFDEYMEHLCAGLGHADRHAGLKGYCTGLMLPLARKSVEHRRLLTPSLLTRLPAPVRRNTNPTDAASSRPSLKADCEPMLATTAVAVMEPMPWPRIGS